MRKIEIQNERITKSLLRKKEIVKQLEDYTAEGEKLTARGKEIEEEVNKLLAKAERENELCFPEITRESEGLELAEFEEVAGVEMEDDGNIYLKIPDRLEEFKAYYHEKKDEEAKKDNGGDTASTDGDSTTDTGLPAELGNKSGD